MLKKLETAAEIKDRTAVLHALHKNKEELKIKIKAAKKKNDAKFSKLRETLNQLCSSRNCSTRWCTTTRRGAVKPNRQLQQPPPQGRRQEGVARVVPGPSH